MKMANKAIIAKKAEVVDEITERVKDAAGVVLFDYRGLTDAEIVQLRRALREENASYKVYKNTLTKRAFDKLSINLDDCLEGPSAMATSDDAIAPIKVLAEFAKTHPALELKGGIVEGKETSKEELANLATIPSRDGLLTMFAAGLMEHVKNVAICLDLHSENLEKENN
jgi:large subunit ribosomal protein L10